MTLITIIAIVLGPILSVQIQKFIENKKEIRNKKMQTFKALMATRATPLYPAHVEALNMIDIEFYNDKRVVETWKLLHDNFYNYPKDPTAKDYESRLTTCSEKSKDLLTDILYEMSKVLGYKFDKVLLKRGCYTPQGHGDIELEQDLIRRGLANLLWGRSSLPITAVEATAPKESQEQKMENNKTV